MANTLPVSPAPTEETQFAVLLFTDICDSTALKAKHGAMAYKAAAELHNALVERLAAEEHLTLIKNTGDGYFARTMSVAAAVRFALCLQYHLRTMRWPSFPLTTRVGIHAGEVADITTLGQADVLAPAADLVARVMSLAVGGQILLTRGPFDEARHFVRNHAAMEGAEIPALTWLAHGPYLFKGCEEPVEVFEVGLTGLAPLVAPPDGEKARRALRPGDEETLGWRPADGLEIPGRPGWRLAEKLGAGGFGEVWAGERDKTRERRAFKFCFDAERLRSLKREVTLTRLLRETLGERDDIVRIYDLRLDEPPYFLESELATEGNLLQWAEKQGGLAAIPLTDRIELVAATATALSAAHSVGVLHKDIKPTNVLIFTGRDGRSRPRLVDFGIGALADAAVLAQHGITGAGFTGATIQHSSGTPTYSPPEYLAGRPFTVQGDVFSLGVMLYQLITGRADAPLAEGWQRDVADELLREDIALCVDGDPSRRLPGAIELATRLRSLPERRAEAARRREAAVAEQSRRKRQRALTAVAAAAILIAAITIPLMLWALREKGNAEKQTGIANKAKTNAESANIEAQKQAGLARDREKEAESEKARALDLIRFIDAQIGEAFIEVPVQLRERVSARVDAFYTEHGTLASLEDHERMGYQIRKAMVNLAALKGYKGENAGEATKKTYIDWERDSAAAALKEAIRLGESFATKPTDDRRITRDRILAHYQLAMLSKRFNDEEKVAEHLRAAQGIFDALDKDGPFSPVHWLDWMALPNLDAAMGDLATDRGDKVGAHAWYKKALTLQSELVDRRPADQDRKTELERIQNRLQETAQ